MGILYRTEAVFSTVTCDILSHILKMERRREVGGVSVK